MAQAKTKSKKLEAQMDKLAQVADRKIKGEKSKGEK